MVAVVIVQVRGEGGFTLNDGWALFGMRVISHFTARSASILYSKRGFLNEAKTFHRTLPHWRFTLCARSPTPAGFLVRICHWTCWESRALTEETPIGCWGFCVCSVGNLLWPLGSRTSGTCKFSSGHSVIFFFFNSLYLLNCLIQR